MFVFLPDQKVEHYIGVKKYPLHLLRRYLVLGSSVSIMSIDTLPANLSNAWRHLATLLDTFYGPTCPHPSWIIFTRLSLLQIREMSSAQRTLITIWLFWYYHLTRSDAQGIVLTTLMPEVPTYPVRVKVGGEDRAVSVEKLEKIGTFGRGNRTRTRGFEGDEVGEGSVY